MNLEPPREMPMEEQSLSPIKIQSLLYIIKKHKWKIVTLFLSTVITVATGSMLATPIYQAKAEILVKPGREDMYVSPTGDSRTIINNSSQENKIQAEIAIMKSFGVVKELVDRIGVDRLFDYPDRSIKGKVFNNKIDPNPKIPPREAVYKAILANLDATGIPRSSVINVSFTWPDPVIAAKVVNTLVDLYLMRHLQIHADPQTYQLLEAQAKEFENSLRQSEKELETFKRLHSITSLSQQKTMLLAKLSEIESLKQQTGGEIKETLQMITALETQLSELKQDVQLQETVNKESSSLAALKARLVELELQGLREEIERVKKMIAEEEKKEQTVVVSGKSPIRQGLEGDLYRAKAKLAALKAKHKSQEARVIAYQNELETLDSFENRLKELERKVTIDEENYNLYLNKFEEAKISENMDKQKISNVSIIESAVPIMRPVKPKKRLNIMVGGFLGLCTGIGIAFLIELINPVFHTREDVQQFLGLPVIATLPKKKLEVLNKDPNKAGRRALLLVASLILIILLGFTLWYFKMYRHGEHVEKQATKPGQQLSSMENEKESWVEIGSSGQIEFVRLAQASPIQVIRKQKIFAKIEQPRGWARSKNAASIADSISQTSYAQIENPTVKLLKNKNGFIFSFKLINPKARTLDQESISGNVAIITALKQPHMPQYISFPKMELGNDGLPLVLSNSLRFSIRNFKNVLGKFDFPFSWAKLFHVLIYNSDEQLVQKHLIRPDEITES